MLTQDMDRANALVDLAALLKKADIICKRHLRGTEIHATGWKRDDRGSIGTVRLHSFCDGIKLVRPK